MVDGPGRSARLEKSWLPAPPPTGRTGWNVPRSREDAEVIQANHIDVSQQSTQPIDAPSITSRTQDIPVVNGIAPQLTLRAEIIGRNSGDEARPMLLIEQEELRVRPNVTGIRGNKEGEIPDQAHALGMGMLPELIGLAEHHKLREANLINLTCQLSTRLGESTRAALNQLCWP